MMRKVVFHGPLKEAHPEPIEVMANTVAEAIELVTGQLPFFQVNPITGRKEISIVGVQKPEDLYRTDLDEIHVVPAISGGKKGGFWKTVIGVTLIVTAIFMGGSTWPLVVATLGMNFLAAGLTELMTPKRDQAEQDPEASKYLGGASNTTAIGTRIPLLFGTDKAFGHILSVDVDAKDVGV
jgi:predicted phage tail protein